MLAILVVISAAFGAVGYFGWRLAVPQPVLFGTFSCAFFAYHYWIERAWRKLEDEASPRVIAEDEREVLHAN